jgi:hypothetical protein
MRALACLLLALCAPAAAQAPAQLSAQQLHVIEDYLDGLTEEELPAARRQALLDAAEVKFEEGTDAFGGIYFARYSFNVPGLAMSTGLDVFATAEEAARGADDIARASIDSSKEQRAPMTELPRGAVDGRATRYFIMTDKQDQPIGNLFVTQKGTHLYRVRMAGAGFFDTPAVADEFLGEKASALLAFRPAVPVQASPKPAALDKQTRAGVTAIALIVLYSAVYLGCRLLVGGLNRLIAPRRIDGRAAGLAGVAAMVVTFMMLGFSALERDGEKFRRLTPFEQGELQGEVIGTTLFPALLVLGAIAVTAALRHFFGKK